MQTDSSFQKDLKTYKNEIKSKLICDSKVSKKFFEDLQNNIDNYIVENNAKSIEEIYKHFGTADDIAKAFFETTDIDTVKRKISIKKLIVILVIAIISIFAIVMIFVGIDATQKNVAYEIQDISDAESIYFIEEQEIYMKKILTIVLCIVCTFSAFSVNVFAEEAQTDVYTDIEYLDDGYYIVTTVVIEDANPVMRATYGKTGAKTSTLYNADDEAMVTLKLTASFSYTGTSSNCTSASTSYTIHEDSWKVTSATATKSGNKATGNFTSKHYVLLIPVQTINSTITLTCSNTGVLS